jgi:hypothetical protein
VVVGSLFYKVFSVTRQYSVDDRVISEWKWIGNNLWESGRGLILWYYLGIRLEGLRKITKILTQDNLSPELRYETGPPEHEAGVTTNWPRRSVRCNRTSRNECCIVQVFHSNRNPNYYTQHLHAQNDETSGNIELLQPYPIVITDPVLEISTTVISAFFARRAPVTETLPISRNFVIRQCNCCLFRYFLVRKHIAKCFTNSSKRFRCEIMYEN